MSQIPIHSLSSSSCLSEEVTVLSPSMKHDKLIITQANQLALSAQKMTLQEKRLAFLLMSLVRREDENFKTYYVPVVSILEYLELPTSKSLYGRLRAICRKFMGRVLDFDDELGGWIQMHWVDRCRFLQKNHRDNPLGVACLEMRLHVDLKPLLLNLKERFGSVAFRQLALMDRFTSMRIAEILFHASYGLKKKQIYFLLDDLKKRLGLEGKYKNFFDFRRDVLEKAQIECQERAPLVFTWDLQKRGKKVVGINFFISKNKNAKIPPPPPIKEARESPQMSIDLPEPSPVITPDQEQADILLERNGVDRAGRTHLIKTYDPERIIQNAQIVIEKHKEGKIDNLGAVTVSAIKNDYRKKISPYEKEQEEKKAIRQKELKAKEEQKRKEEEEADRRIEKDRQRRKAAVDIYQKLDQQEKERIFDSIKSKIGQFDRAKMLKEGEGAMGFQIRLPKELNDKLPPELQEN